MYMTYSNQIFCLSVRGYFAWIFEKGLEFGPGVRSTCFGCGGAMLLGLFERIGRADARLIREARKANVREARMLRVVLQNRKGC